MWSLGVVSGWWIYCLPHNEVSLLHVCLWFFGNIIPIYFLFNCCVLFLIRACIYIYILIEVGNRVHFIEIGSGH